MGKQAVCALNTGGMLATWMRIKYPHILDGAIAGSAPIWTYLGEVGAPIPACPLPDDQNVQLYGDWMAPALLPYWAVLL